MEAFITYLFVGAVAWFVWRRFVSNWFHSLAGTKKVKARLQAFQIPEEAYYEMAAKELEQGSMRKGLWLKAVAETGGNDAAARSKYLKLRVEALRSEAAVALAAAAERHNPEDVPPADSVRPGSANPSTVIQCPQCQGKLRIPAGRILDVTCPHCRFEFRTSSVGDSSS